MLSVGVEHEHAGRRRRAGAQAVESGPYRRALAAIAIEAQQGGAGLGDPPFEETPPRRAGAVVHDQDASDA